VHAWTNLRVVLSTVFAESAWCCFDVSCAIVVSYKTCSNKSGASSSGVRTVSYRRNVSLLRRGSIQASVSDIFDKAPDSERGARMMKQRKRTDQYRSSCILTHLGDQSWLLWGSADAICVRSLRKRGLNVFRNGSFLLYFCICSGFSYPWMFSFPFHLKVIDSDLHCDWSYWFCHSIYFFLVVI